LLPTLTIFVCYLHREHKVHVLWVGYASPHHSLGICITSVQMTGSHHCLHDHLWTSFKSCSVCICISQTISGWV
jgi:hypothetical protein